MLLQPKYTPLMLLPLIPLVGLLSITILLRPACHAPTFISAPQACEAYKLVAFILDAMIALALVFVIVLLWCRGQLLGSFEPDLESLSMGVDAEQCEFVNATERDPLISRARAYTFRVRQLPFLNDYGTIPGMDPEAEALLGFYRFPGEDVFGSLNLSSGSGSYASVGTTVGARNRPLNGSPESVSPTPLERVSPRPLEKDENDGWTRWQWRQSTVGMSACFKVTFMRGRFPERYVTGERK